MRLIKDDQPKNKIEDLMSDFLNKVIYLIFSSISYFFSQPLLRVGVCPELA